MAAGPLDQLEQTLERSIENVRQVSINEIIFTFKQMNILQFSGADCCLRLSTTGTAWLESEVAASS